VQREFDYLNACALGALQFLVLLGITPADHLIPTDSRWLIAFSMECQQTSAAYLRRERKDAPHLNTADRLASFHLRGRT